MDREAQSQIVELIRDRIVHALHPRKLILFGSRARGDAAPDSDYDLLVVQDTEVAAW